MNLYQNEPRRSSSQYAQARTVVHDVLLVKVVPQLRIICYQLAQASDFYEGC